MIDYRQVHSGAMHSHTGGGKAQLGRPISRHQIGNNFSYPRAEGHPIRHESANSRSSVNSNGSLPGMTDSSDSEASVDDDYHYNTSASELWDSFWPTGTNKAQRIQKPLKPSTARSQKSEALSLECHATARTAVTEDDAVTISQSEKDLARTTISLWPLPPKASPQQLRSQTPRVAARYSVYPKPTPLPTQITLLPPRSSSLTSELTPRPLNGSKSVANLNSRASTHGLYLAPPLTTCVTVSQQQQPSLHASRPVGPQRKLHPSASAYNVRERSHHNATAPLAPVPAIPEQLRSAPPQIEHFVSVFDFDSDNESDSGPDTFAKRIARGLHHKKSLREMGSKREHTFKGHKKSASEKSALNPEKKTIQLVDGSNSLSRKRGGSLGRMLGFKSSK